MIKVLGITMPLDADADCCGGISHTQGLLVRAVAETLGIAEKDIARVEVLRRSVDARRKSNVHFVVNAAVALASSQQEAECVAVGCADTFVPYEPLSISDMSTHRTRKTAPVVVGTGPAGLFCALYLARAGLAPTVVERGQDVAERARRVAAFEAQGVLDPNCNIQFGEGGAGTFSDGKLTTNIKHRMREHVLHWFTEAGAPSQILWDARPHIGSDRLPAVVEHMRNEIIERGGQVLFGCQLVDVNLANGVLRSIDLLDLATGEHRTLATTQLVLALGHSARDTFQMLHSKGLAMEQKAFSVGVRIEHRQEDINHAQWGSDAGHPALGAAEYKLACHIDNEQSQRHAYTFCMCPGGTVVCAASEPNAVATNGMSSFSRDGINANAGLLVNVDPNDFGAEDPLAGMRLQQSIERAAYREAFEMGGSPYAAPAQTVGDFLATSQASDTSCAFDNSSSSDSPYVPDSQWQNQASNALVSPTYARGVVFCDLHKVLPDYVCAALERAIPEMGRKLAGFDSPTALLTAPETRSSSPVRICRNRCAQAWVGVPGEGDTAAASGIYPCGEGAGYAGGIMSAACDGLAVAEQIVETYCRCLQNPDDLRELLAKEDAVVTVDDVAMEAAVDVLRAGGSVVFPTDTVVGLGISIRHAQDLSQIYRIKQREAEKPVAWLVDSPQALDIYGAHVPDYARELAQEGWPGALTLIVHASDAVPAAFRSAQGTIGLRMPNSAVALDLIQRLGCPLATSSANISGSRAVGQSSHVDTEVLKQATFVLDFNEPVQYSGRASRVIDCTGLAPVILRQG